MLLAEVDGLETERAGRLAVQAAIDAWQGPASAIADHCERCCQIAREWLFATDYSQLNAGHHLMGPRWIRQRYTWGPTRWPIHWCEALDESTLDCGALAALATAVFLSRGVQACPAQLVQRYTRDDSRHWFRNWELHGAGISWVKDDLVYHEASAVMPQGNELGLWDPTASWWVNPNQAPGYGEVLALRILTSDPQQIGHFRWGAHSIPANHWHILESDHRDLTMFKSRSA